MVTDILAGQEHEELETPRSRLRRINQAFNERIRQVVSGKNRDYTPLELGRPSAFLIEIGTPDLPIELALNRLLDKKLQGNHPFSIVSVLNMPEHLANPIAVFQSKTRLASKVVLTEMEEKGVNFVVPIEMKRVIGIRYVNDVRSLYPKDNMPDILRWIFEFRLLEYCNKEKTLNWLDKQQSNSAEVTKLIKGSTKLVQGMGISK